ncbi:phosphoenolpyruvate-protein phosphotransferase [Alicyclobacillus acidoterrestris]|uniref:phosphoenolpyruvate--protein phosphotransferase n=1 Tax=Alicyclobacillus suci TaxID=2816080 RepID=UPI00119514EF|nr:phosphoenolpyruvate--protein phosphotransferase [Alicyclobacillus suci]GEO25444.1 phosphoenolpyruvate-protein phosphotransferase [Alicyclobacillus acidoterrestris]
MLEFQGVPVSEGIALGPCFIVDTEEFVIEQTTADDVAKELKRVQTAREQVAHRLQQQLDASDNEPQGEILRAHLSMLNDPQLATGIETSIQTNRESAEYAVSHNLLSYAEMLEALPDEYLRERAQDLRDLRLQWLAALFGKSELVDVPSGAIVIATELLPSQFLQVKSHGIGGIVTEQGGTTSHVSILARNFGIPMVTGVQTSAFDGAESVAINGQDGRIIINPDDDTKTQFNQARETYETMMRQAHENRMFAATTRNGQTIEVAANIGGPDDLEEVLANGADGIGLFRTEFLFMDRSAAPTENEQYEVYRRVAEAMAGKRVVIRTLDAGADKKVSYLHFDDEENPFLGVRGLRYTLKYPELFQTQLKAVLRAAQHGKISLMFPMVTNVADVEAAIEAVDEARRTLTDEGQAYGSVELGAMIEVPAAALITDLLAEKLDFVSVGTNDLIQYTTASDRMNPAVTAWYEPGHPGLWRLLEQVSRGAHQQGAWVGMCGELAGTLEFVPRLVELGFDELSMSPKRIGLIKTAIRNL